ncbi:hypothetical protein KR059_009201 [Drosophila kikkawai]|nr:hypothetical protein KR059_009201 [Drosophila kikkawai]
MDNPKKGSIFTLGPAPPGHRPPNTSLFKRLEYNLMAMSRHIRGTTAKIDLLRSAHRIEISTAMRKSIKEQIMLSIRDQILARKVMAKNSLELKALQDAEILKVVRHLHEIDKNRQEWSHNLARLKVDLKQESDPEKVRCLQKEIYALIKDLKKSKDLRERWRLRMVQMEAAKIKVLQPPTNNQSVDESDMISSAKSTTEKEAPNVVENINKTISSPKPNTNTICLSKTVALISKVSITKKNMFSTY